MRMINMTNDKRAYTNIRRRNVTVIRGRNKDEIFEIFFPGIRHRIATDNLIDEQTRMLNQNIYKTNGI